MPGNVNLNNLMSMFNGLGAGLGAGGGLGVPNAPFGKYISIFLVRYWKKKQCVIV